MKEGAGEDPFAADADTAGTDSDEASSTTSSEATTDTTDADDTPTSDQQSPQQQSIQIPYKFRRDGVQDGRERVPLFLKPDTKNAERDALRELEDRFGENVSLTDLREGLMKAGLAHLDEVEDHLEQWGYGMTFDE